MTLGTLKDFKFFFFSFVYYIFVANIWFTVGHYFLWKCNALFACKSFCCSSINWMLFSYNLGILPRRVCIYIYIHTHTHTQKCCCCWGSNSHTLILWSVICNWGTLLTNLFCRRFQFFFWVYNYVLLAKIWFFSWV